MSKKTLREAECRVERLVDFYRQFSNTTLDMMDSETDVTMADLRTLLEAAGWKHPKHDTADAPCETCGKLDNPYCSNPFHAQRQATGQGPRFAAQRPCPSCHATQRQNPAGLPRRRWEHLLSQAAMILHRLGRKR